MTGQSDFDPMITPTCGRFSNDCMLPSRLSSALGHMLHLARTHLEAAQHNVNLSAMKARATGQPELDLLHHLAPIAAAMDPVDSKHGHDSHKADQLGIEVRVEDPSRRCHKNDSEH